MREVGSLLGYLTARGANILTACDRYSQLLLLPLGVPPMPVPACSTQKSFQDREVWRVLTTTGVGNVTPSSISSAQHAQTCCQLFQGFTAACSGCPPYQGPAVGPRRCFAVGVRPMHSSSLALPVASVLASRSASLRPPVLFFFLMPSVCRRQPHLCRILKGRSCHRH